jgi:3-oxoacyl-[acyl-carrier-protein] synthase II
LASDRSRRVVVTGMGLVTSIGIGREAVWASALAGRSGAGPITLFDPTEHVTKFACEAAGFDPVAYMDAKSARRMDRFAQLAVAAGKMAVEDAKLPLGADGNDRFGAIVASGVGGLKTFEEQVAVLLERGPTRVSPLFIPMMIANMGAAQLSMALGLRGPLSCPVTACASGNHAIGDALEVIRRDQADVMLAGGAEAAITPIGIASFNSMKALSTRNDDPATASRPFDVGRDGFVMGEAGAVLVLEELGHAEARGADIWCEVVGYGMSGDAHHLTEPDPTGHAPALAMRMAMADAGVEPQQVDYINVHGTSTPVGDPSEIRVIQKALGAEVAARVAVSSTKSMHGHCLGATGGVEAALGAMAIRAGVIPPTINLADLDPECGGVDHVANVPRQATVDVMLSNGFGFGGHNATIALASPRG